MTLPFSWAALAGHLPLQGVLEAHSYLLMSVLVAGEPPFPMQPMRSLSLLIRERVFRAFPLPRPLSPDPKGVLHRRQGPLHLIRARHSVHCLPGKLSMHLMVG